MGVDFEVGTDLDTALADVRARLDATRADLPTDASSPVTTSWTLVPTGDGPGADRVSTAELTCASWQTSGSSRR